MKNPRPCGRGLIGRGHHTDDPPVSLNGLEAALTLKLFTGEFPRTANGFGLLARFFDGGFLEMLLELHFPKHALALELFLQGPKGLIDIVVANADLHVVVTTFLS